MQGHKSQFRDKQSRFSNQSVPARKGSECDLDHHISLQARQEKSSLEARKISPISWCGSSAIPAKVAKAPSNEGNTPLLSGAQPAKFSRRLHSMSFRSVFLAVVIAFALILAGFLVNRARPKVETAAADRRLRSRIGQMRRMPRTAAILRRSRIRNVRSREEGRQLP